jgi:DNA replicative helicase MCM subunit Mcm2 (Cdc46/Mcm family)
MKKSILVIFFIAFLSCNQKNSNQIEPNAVKKVLDFYKGEGKLIKNAESNCYEIELSKSELLNYDVNSIDYHAGNIAYIIHKNLKVKDYDCVKVKINLNNGDSFDFNYSVKELSEVESYIPNFEEVSNLIMNKDYEKLFYQFDKSFNPDRQSIEKIFTNVESKLGKLNNIYYTGFKNFETEECGKVIEFKAVLVHDKMPINMFLCFSKKNKKLVLLLIP